MSDQIEPSAPQFKTKDKVRYRWNGLPNVDIKREMTIERFTENGAIAICSWTEDGEVRETDVAVGWLEYSPTGTRPPGPPKSVEPIKMESNIVPGSVVCLKSGGPSMTVQRVNDGTAHCDWFDSQDNVQHRSFVAIQLQIALEESDLWRVWWKSPSGWKSTDVLSPYMATHTFYDLSRESSLPHLLLKDYESPPGEDEPTAEKTAEKPATCYPLGFRAFMRSKQSQQWNTLMLHMWSLLPIEEQDEWAKSESMSADRAAEDQGWRAFLAFKEGIDPTMETDFIHLDWMSLDPHSRAPWINIEKKLLP